MKNLPVPKNKVLSIKYLVLSMRSRFAKYKIQNTIYSNLPSRKGFLRGVRDFKRLKIAEKALVVFYIFVFLFVSLAPYFSYFYNPNGIGQITENGKKIAEGVWENPPAPKYAPIKQVLADNTSDLTIKELKFEARNPKCPLRQNSSEASKNEIQNSKEDSESDSKSDCDNEKYRYGVTLSSGTKFMFGLETKEGLLPKVHIQNSQGYFISYVPSKIPNTKYQIQPVTPKLKKNVISWPIDEGITARYTMMQDRVKADYIVNHKSSILNHRLDFDVDYGYENQNSKVKSQNLNSKVEIEEMPNGDLALLNENLEEQFVLPAPITFDKNKKEIDSHFSLSADEKTLSIILSPEDLATAVLPITIDPVVIYNSATADFTAYGNARKIVRDAWGNFIVVFRGSTASTNHIYYKKYSSNTWTIGPDSPSSLTRPAIDLDSVGNGHIVYSGAGNVRYFKLTVTRNGANEITNLSASAALILDASALTQRPSIIIANKGGGAGVEKVAIAWDVNTTGATPRGEIRFMQCDIADDCTIDDNWKNASEEINGNGICSDIATSGDAGLPDTTANAGCKGTADATFIDITANTKHHVVLTQMPAVPKRSPASVKKDLNGTFSDLNNLEDGNSGTTDNINSLTTTDYLYVGDLKLFSKISIDIDTTNSNAQTFSTTQYCSANSDVDTTCDTWTAVANFIDNTATATTTLLDSGDSGLKGSFLFDEPSDWVQSTENGTKEYWTRFRPSGALDSTVSLADIYVTDRNSKALVVIGGVDRLDDLGASYMPWDEIGNAGWENNPASAGVPWRENGTALDTLGGNWTTFTNYPLTATIDYINNRGYVAYIEDLATDVTHVKTAPNNKDLTVAASWTDTSFPTVTEAADIVASLTSDGQDIYLFYILDPGTNNLVYRKCTGSADGATSCDWDASESTLVSDITLSHPQAVVTKTQGDTIAIDIIYTDTTDVDVLYERHYVNSQDKTVVVAAGGDDAYHRDCDTTGDDQNITAASSDFGRDFSDSGCDSGGADYHFGIRFSNIIAAQGAAISSAYVDFQVVSRIGGGSPLDFTVYGNDIDNSNAFTTYVNNCPASGDDRCVGERPKTTSSTAASIDFTTVTYRVDVTSIVQEIVCRGAANAQPCVGNYNGTGSWASGNSLTVLMVSTEGGGADNSVTITANDSTTGILEPTLQINCGVSCSVAAPDTTAWASIDGTPATSDGAADLNTNWTARKKVNFNNTSSSENLTDFPVLLRLTSSNIDYAKTKASGEDLRFVDPAAPSTLLDYEIEKWDEAGESLVWVKVPQVDARSGSDYIWMYYNNANADAGQDGANTWNSNFISVWHSKETSGTNIADSKGASNGTKTSATEPNPITGKIDGAQDYDGSNDTVSIANESNFDFERTNSFSLKFWVKPDTGSTASQVLLSKMDNSAPFRGWDIIANDDSAINDPGKITFQLSSTWTSNVLALYTTNDTNINDGNWHHYVVTYDGTSTPGGVKLYEDGTSLALTTRYNSLSTTTLNDISPYIGSRNQALYHNGILDEVRISNSVRTAEWIEAEYLSQNGTFEFAIYGSEQAVAASSQTTLNYSLGSATQLATGSASFSDLDHPFSSAEYTLVASDDASFVPLVSTNQYASTSAVPAFMFKVNNPNNNTNNRMDPIIRMKSSVPTSTRSVYLQVYRGGSTDNWVTIDDDKATAANTDFTLSAAVTSSTLEHYINETPGIGTSGADCTNNTANCWAYFRVYQDSAGSTTDMVLSVDYANVAFSENAPTKVAFTNSNRTLTAGVCGGTGLKLTVETQNDASQATYVTGNTVITVTSDSPSETIYSDSGCTTSDNTLDFSASVRTVDVYFKDTRKSSPTWTLTASKTSGPETLSNGTQTYTVNAGALSKLLITLPGETFTDGTGNSGSTTNRTAGSSFNITISAIDANNNVVPTSAYANGNHTLVFSGPANAPDTTVPTVGGTNIGSNTTVSFTSGQATSIATILYKAQSTTLTATDGGSYGQASTSVTVGIGDITPSDASIVSSVTSTTNINTNVTIDITLRDSYENTLASFDGGANISFSATTSQYNVTTPPGTTDSFGVTSAVIQWSTQGTKTVTLTVTGHGVLSDTHIVTVGAPTPRSKIQGGSTIKGGTRL